MKKHIRAMLALATVLIMAFTMGSCSLKADADEIFSGELVDAQNERLVVKSPDKTMLFVTTAKTEYDLGEDEEGLCVGDKLDVSFHKEKDIYVADTVKVTEHKDDTLVFGGQVTELEKHYITIRSESLTAGFDYDEETEIVGNLTKGDSVTVTYKGNISERPYAISIVVIQEKREEVLKSIHGTVSEATDKSVLVSMDSADAARFKVTEDTIIKGDAKKVIAGDEVTLVYTGEIGKDPVARTITIKRDMDQKYYVMDGVIDKVAKDTITIKTMNRSYKFKIAKDTRIQNKKYMEKDHKCTITYVGDLFKDPTAASIYCSKKTLTDNEKKKATSATKETVTKATKETEATKTEPTETKTEPTETQTEPTETQTEPTETQTQTEPTETQTEPTETQTEATEPETEATEPETEATEAPTKAPEPVVIKAKGVITNWGNPCAIKLDGGGTVKLDIKNANVSGGYVPEVNDQVVIKYDKDNMKLTDIQLEYRPSDDADAQ